MTISKLFKILTICCCSTLMMYSTSDAANKQIIQNTIVIQNTIDNRLEIKCDLFQHSHIIYDSENGCEYKYWVPKQKTIFLNNTTMIPLNSEYKSNHYVTKHAPDGFPFGNEQVAFSPIELQTVANKMMELFDSKQKMVLQNDVITDLQIIVNNIFGNNSKIYFIKPTYDVYEPWRCDLLNEEEPSKRIVEYEDDNGNIKKYKVRFDGTFKEYMKQNSFEVVTYITGVSALKCINKIFDIYNHIVIQIGNDILYCDISASTVDIYHKPGMQPEEITTNIDKLVSKLNEIASKLQTRFNKEKELVQKVFGENYEILY